MFKFFTNALETPKNLKFYLTLYSFNCKFQLVRDPKCYLVVNNLTFTSPVAAARYISNDSTQDSWLELAESLTNGHTDYLFLENKIQLLTNQLASIMIFGSLYNSNWPRAEFPNISKWMQSFENTLVARKALQAWSLSTISKQNVITLDHHDRTILPIKNARNVLITSALPYVNNIPHLGNIIGCVLSADVFARYCRLRGYNTLYIGGTDEYGTATEVKALEEGISCSELCQKYFEKHREVYEWFGIDFDKFGRSSTPLQTEITQDIFLKLEKNGHTYEDTISQLYCEKHESFLADRFVEGTCPLCGYSDARGDQCDSCGKLLNATDLVDPKCKLDGHTPVMRTSKHIFLNLSEHQKVLESWFEQTSVDGSWTQNSSSITTKWLKEGLRPRCITRDLKWGTPVPKQGYERKVFYVWFDAPIGYISITGNYSPDWKQWWKNPENVKLYQFMGKDNVPFHTVIFPSTLIGTNEPWTLLHHLSTTEYLQYENGKFSKSRGIGVFGNDVAKTKIPVEVWRYYLISMRPEGQDSEFTWNGLAVANNNELLTNLGNFVNRIVKFVKTKYDGVIPESVPNDQEARLISNVNARLSKYIESLEVTKLRAGLKLFMEISTLGNQYLQDNKLSNSLFSDEKVRCDTVVNTAINLVYLLSALVYPYMPTTAAQILEQLKAPLRKITNVWEANDIKCGHEIGEPSYLFQAISESKIEEMRKTFAGKQAVVSPKKEVNLKSEPINSKVSQELSEKITEQGNLVRKLKTEKAPADEIKKQVEVLLQLKSQLTKAS